MQQPHAGHRTDRSGRKLRSISQPAGGGNRHGEVGKTGPAVVLAEWEKEVRLQSTGAERTVALNKASTSRYSQEASVGRDRRPTIRYGTTRNDKRCET